MPNLSPRIAIIGAGANGLTTALWLKEFLPNSQLTIFENAPQVGGKIHSTREDGFLIEWGAHLLMIQRSATLELCQKLDLMEKLVYGSATSSKRYLFLNGKIQPIAETPWQFLRQNPLTISGWLRLLQEPFISVKKDFLDESLQSHAYRRLGKEFSEKFINPLARGILAGDPANISVQASFGHLPKMEKTYGSLARAYAKTYFTSKNISSSSLFASFANGHQTLIDALTTKLIHQGIEIICEASVKSLMQEKDYLLAYERHGEKHKAQFDSVVLSLPAPDCANICKNLLPQLQGFMEGIPYSSLVSVSIGLNEKQSAFIPEGFGFLVPRQEKSPILSCVFSSQIFPNRAPKDFSLLNLSLGGSEYPELPLISETDIGKLAWTNLQNIFNLSGEPRMLRVHKHLKAMPQYPIHHLQNLKLIEDKALKALPGLYLAGSAYYGTGLENAFANAKIIAKNISTYFSSK